MMHISNPGAWWGVSNVRKAWYLVSWHASRASVLREEVVSTAQNVNFA